MIKGFVLVVFFGLCNLCQAENYYRAPPSSTTRAHVPVISDEMMERCVKVYNEADWLQKELQTMVVDRYSQSSVDSYNSKVRNLNDMTRWFNSNCAGKQSYSACKKANELNMKNGLPAQSCR